MSRVIASILVIVFTYAFVAVSIARTGDPTPCEPGSAEAVWAEIQDRVAAQDQRLDELNRRLGTAPDAETSLELQREVARVKMQTEMDVMDIQLKHARIRGDQDLVKKLETAIYRMKHPEEVIRELQAANPTPPGQRN